MVTTRHYLNIIAGGLNLIENQVLSKADYDRHVNNLIHDSYVNAPDVTTTMFVNRTCTVHRFYQDGVLIKLSKWECKPGYHFFRGDIHPIKEVNPRV